MIHGPKLCPAMLVVLALCSHCQESEIELTAGAERTALSGEGLDLYALSQLEPASATSLGVALDRSHELLHQRAGSLSSAQERELGCRADPRVALELVSQDVCVGAELFFRAEFSGNGRTCSSCHPASNNFTIDRPFIDTLAPDDPLFVADNDPALAQLEVSRLLHEHGLVLVNADGLEAPAEKFVVRGSSHIYSLATTTQPTPILEDGTTFDQTTQPPYERLGWSGDGSPGQGKLRDFPLGAIQQHHTRSLGRVGGVDFALPSEPQLDAMASFMREVGRKNELDLAAVHLSDAAAERGRRSFLSGPAQECNDCHSNAGANNKIFEDDGVTVIGLANFNFHIGSERVRLPLVEELEIPADGGYGKEPFDREGDGVIEFYGRGRFNVQTLIEAADTGPFFHANTAETIEDAIEFYNSEAFAASPQGLRITPSRPEAGPFKLTDREIAELGRFLRVLNASFNLQSAVVRLGATSRMLDAPRQAGLTIPLGLIALARYDLADALRVLRGVPYLNTDAQVLLEAADWSLVWASSTRDNEVRAAELQRAILGLRTADAALGSGILLQLGVGLLMF